MKGTRLVVLTCAALMITGCMGQKKMVKTSGMIREKLVMQDYNGALKVLRAAKKDGFKEQDRVAYWMDEGMLLHLLGRYKESSKVLKQADQRAEELFTKSISKSIKAAFTSQAATDYQGEDYEKVLLNIVKAFNYMGQGNVSGALVEARKINRKLVYYNTKYKKKSVYNQDAFAHWMMGLLFEIEGSLDDARIAYKHAVETYDGDFKTHYGFGTPAFVAEDYLRAAILNNDQDLIGKIKQKYGVTGRTAEAIKKNGEIVLFHLNGEGPNKSDYFINCIFKSATAWFCDGEPGGEFITRKKLVLTRPGFTALKIAFPRLHTHKVAIPYLEMSVGEISTRTQPALPINAIARKVFRDKTARVFKNAIIRAVTKALTQAAAGAIGKKAGGKGAGWLASRAVGLINQATEEADKRAWTTLPARIDVGRLFVPAGTHTVTLFMPGGRRYTIPNVKVQAGKRVFITYRTIP
jgi:hypothetical protein